MKRIRSNEDVMDTKTSKRMPNRSRTVVSASALALILACSAQPEPAFAQFDIGGFAGGVVGGLLAHRGGGYGYRYAPRYGSRHAYAGRRSERRVARSRDTPTDKDQGASTPAPAAVASAPAAPAASGPMPVPAAEHHTASGPGNGSFH